MSTDCGTLSAFGNSTYSLLTHSSEIFHGIPLCQIIIESITFDVNIILTQFWANPVYYGPAIEHVPIVVLVNQTIDPIVLPYAANLVNGAFPSLNLIYFADPPLPEGIYFSGNYILGKISSIGDTHVTVYAQDVFNRLKLPIGNYTFIAAQPQSTVSPTAELATTIAIPILVTGLLILFIFYIRQRRIASQPFNFTNMASLNSSEIQLNTPYQAPRELGRSTVKIVEMLGKGSFGEVYKGLYTERRGTPGYLVAVKAMVNAADQAANRIQLLSEASLMVQFDHENVVKLIGVVTSGDPMLIILEYCEAGALETVLRSLELNLEHHLKLSIDCAKGMVYLASLNFVHRDLAARNVLISSDFTAKIGDFGLSRINVNSEYYISRNATLSIRWSSPEALEEHRFSEQSDVWSFGVLMWEIWSNGTLPYNGMSAKNAWNAVIKGARLLKPHDCPHRVFSVISSCWSEYGSRPTFSTLLNQLVLMRISDLKGKEPLSVDYKPEDRILDIKETLI